MTNGVQNVYQLFEKVSGMIDWARGNGVEPNSLRSLAKATGIKYATLASNMKRYRISRDNQQKLAEAFGFDVDWPEWRDPEETRRSEHRDTADAFLARFVAERSNSGRLTIESGPTLGHLDSRFANFYVAAMTAYGAEGAKFAIPMSVALSFDRRGWSVLLEGGRGILNIGLKQADLQFFYDRTDAKIEVFPLTYGNGMDGNFRGDVEGLSAWWVINVTAGELPWLAGKRVSDESQDCVCRGFRAGDCIEAIMTARVSDCFVCIEGDLLVGVNEVKVCLIKHLAKLSVLREAEAVLCQQTLKVVKK